MLDGRVRATNMREWDDLVNAFHGDLPEVFRTWSGALRILDTTSIVKNGWNMCGNLLKRVAPRARDTARAVSREGREDLFLRRIRT